jgi:hypothetical protein
VSKDKRIKELEEGVADLLEWIKSLAISFDAIAEEGDGQYGLAKASLKEYAECCAEISRGILVEYKQLRSTRGKKQEL